MADQENKQGTQPGVPSSSPQGAEDAKLKAEQEAKAKADKDAAETKAKAEAKADKDKKSKKYTVIYPFADKDNFGKKWVEGDDVSHFDDARLADCVKRELVKKG
ncbi:hypothetical protein [Sphingobacterium spiritivorum]|uniref:hypothetical protein n=1 Tax=Sphingobacterium spiritivorum TaxID=258 RepID=UPI001919F5E5|nr:hypothetical protein [Sphingobacterium spiritivorum]QQT26826.1 hypothetical protein I6J02_02880 [Sphingobacterium spiritivorum]